MQKCFYHGKTDAVTVCIGCKMPVCQTCNGEGQKGFCETCMKKVAKLGEKVLDPKKTGFAKADQKATIMKTAERAPGRDARYCFHHADLVASAACMTCNRPFCPACLNTQGNCTFCVRQAEAEPVVRPARPVVEVAEAPVSDRNKKLVVAGLVAVVLVVGAVGMTKKRGDRPQPSAMSRLQSEELTPKERALMAQLNQEAKNAQSIPDAPRQAAAPAGGESAVYVPQGRSGGGTVRRAAAATGGGGPVRVRVYSPGVASGMALIRASVSGEVDRVEFSVDGQWAGASNSPPYTFEWASQSVANGRHRVTVEAYGTDGRKAVSSASFTVRN